MSKELNVLNTKHPQAEQKSAFYHKYLEALSVWFGDRISLLEDFDAICHCEVDFIENLLLGEREFTVSLLGNSLERKDFKKINDFLIWAKTKRDAKIQ